MYLQSTQAFQPFYLNLQGVDAVCDVPTHTSKMLEQELNYTYTIQNTTSSKQAPTVVAHGFLFAKTRTTTDIRIRCSHRK